MTFLERIGSMFDLVRRPRVRFTGAVAGNGAGMVVTNQTALAHAAVWACVRVITETVAGLPWQIVQSSTDPQGQLKRQRMTGGAVDWILNKQANPEMTAFSWRETALAHVLLTGNHYSEIQRDVMGRPLWLWPLVPETCRPFRDPDGVVRYRVWQEQGPETVLEPRDVLHVKGLGWDGVTGFSVITMARRSIGIGLAMDEFAANFYRNGATLGLVFEHPRQLSEKAQQNFKDSIQAGYTGPGNAFRTIVVEEGMKLAKAQMSMIDAQFNEQEKHMINEIARWFRVPPHKIQDLQRATFCLPADEPVFTESGQRPIAEIKAGERVWSYDKLSGKLTLSKVERSECTGEQEILTLRTRNRTLRCTANHRLAVWTEHRIPFVGGAGRYTVDEVGRYRNEWHVEWREAGSLTPGDYLIGVNALPEQTGVACPTRESVSVEFMEVLGMLIGDGFYARDSKTGKGSSFGISHSEHNGYMAHYVAATEKEFKASFGKPLKAARRDKNTTVFYSTAAHEELEQCGIVGTAKTKRVPGWIFSLERKLQLAFLRGYLDADGTVNANGQIRYVSVNRDLIDDVAHLCVAAGVAVGNTFSTEIASDFGGKQYTHTLWAVICTDVDDNLVIGTHTPLYQERMEARRAALRDRVCAVYPNEQKRRNVGEGLFATRITEIEHGEKEPVYDLCVNDTHTFMASKLLISNSNIEHQSIEFVQDTITPWCRRLEQEVDVKLFGMAAQRSITTKLGTDVLLRGDFQGRMTGYKTGRDAGILSVNDCRALENLDPVEGGDMRLQPMNMVPLGTIPPPLPGAEAVPQDPGETSPDETPPNTKDAPLNVAPLRKVN